MTRADVFNCNYFLFLLRRDRQEENVKWQINAGFEHALLVFFVQFSDFFFYRLTMHIRALCEESDDS